MRKAEADHLAEIRKAQILRDTVNAEVSRQRAQRFLNPLTPVTGDLVSGLISSTAGSPLMSDGEFRDTV
jgi:hypothetical protein